MSKRLTTTEFIKRAKQIHGDKYDYSKAEYVDAHTKICIICPKHGEFLQMPYSHLNGIGCKKCGYEKNALNKRKEFNSIVEQARKVHGDKYRYINFIYTKNSKTKLRIECPIHGEFIQTFDAHINHKHGCPKCAKSGIRLTTKEFVERAKAIHGNKYDYSKVEYVNAHTKIKIICPIHGEFTIMPYSHLNGAKCPKCAHRSFRYSQEEFIEEAKKIHGDKYDYSKVNYTNNHTKVCIICPIHGEFWQMPMSHLKGQGCPTCKSSHLEKETSVILDNQKIDYIQHCSKSKLLWLGRQHLDFYLPKYNIAIECQGEQHFKPVEHFGGEEHLKYTKSLDLKKKCLCEEHNVKLYYINYDDNVKTKIKEILKKTKCLNI